MKRALRSAGAALLGIATWAGLVWIASLILPIPPGAIVFTVVFVVALLIVGMFAPLSGFGTGSFAIGVGLIAASWVAIGVMDTPFWPLAIGVIIIFFAGSPSMWLALYVMEE